MKQPSLSIKNKKALFEYTILDSWEAGVILTGEEVKSIRHNHLDFSNSYISFRTNTLWWIGSTIAKYQHSSNAHYVSQRDRQLLVRQEELERISKALQHKGVTLIPLEGYFKHQRFKLKIGLGKGKKQYDKRETIKTRELNKEIKRKMGRFK